MNCVYCTDLIEIGGVPWAYTRNGPSHVACVALQQAEEKAKAIGIKGGQGRTAAEVMDSAEIGLIAIVGLIALIVGVLIGMLF